MPTKTQLRLNQITGSAVDIKPSALVKGVNAASLVAGDISGSLEYIAQAITNVHGLVEFGAQTPGAFNHPRFMITGSLIDFNQSAGVAATGSLILEGSTGVQLKENNVTIFSIADNRNVAIQNAAAVNIDGSGAIAIESSGGTISVGADDVNQAINIGTEGTRTITIGEAANSTLNLKSRGGTFLLDGTGQTVDVDSAAFDLDASGEVTLSTTAGILLESTEAQADSIDINAKHANGGIDLRVNDNMVLSVLATQVDIAQSVDIADTTASTSKETGALVVDGGVGIGLDLFVGDDLTVDGDTIHFSGAGLSVLSGANIDIRTDVQNTGNITLDAKRAGVQLSGSLGIGLSGSLAISADQTGFTNLNGTAQAGKMLFAAYNEFATFRSKALFGSSTTVIGALNALHDAAGGGVVGKMVISASVDSPDSFALTGMSGSDGFTSSIALTEANPANTDIFLNGQLLTSGTLISGANQNADYRVVSHASPGVVQFAFDLEVDDVLVVKTTSEQ